MISLQVSSPAQAISYPRSVISSTTPFKVGDRVAYNSFFSYAEYTCVPAAKLIPVPDVVGLDVATACVVQGMTAHYLTHSAHADLIAPGEWMLVHGAGGGTCQWAAQMAKIKGYKVIGTAAKGKADIARSTGVDELILLDETPGTACVARARPPGWRPSSPGGWRQDR